VYDKTKRKKVKIIIKNIFDKVKYQVNYMSVTL